MNPPSEQIHSVAVIVSEDEDSSSHSDSSVSSTATTDQLLFQALYSPVSISQAFSFLALLAPFTREHEIEAAVIIGIMYCFFRIASVHEMRYHYWPLSLFVLILAFLFLLYVYPTDSFFSLQTLLNPSYIAFLFPVCLIWFDLMLDSPVPDAVRASIYPYHGQLRRLLALHVHFRSIPYHSRYDAYCVAYEAQVGAIKSMTTHGSTYVPRPQGLPIIPLSMFHTSFCQLELTDFMGPVSLYANLIFIDIMLTRPTNHSVSWNRFHHTIFCRAHADPRVPTHAFLRHSYAVLQAALHYHGVTPLGLNRPC